MQCHFVQRLFVGMFDYGPDLVYKDGTPKFHYSIDPNTISKNHLIGTVSALGVIDIRKLHYYCPFKRVSCRLICWDLDQSLKCILMMQLCISCWWNVLTKRGLFMYGGTMQVYVEHGPPEDVDIDVNGDVYRQVMQAQVMYLVQVMQGQVMQVMLVIKVMMVM